MATIQVFGTKKCHDTLKALRFFKERSVQIQFINLEEKAVSKGELESISRNVPLSELIDPNSKEYKKRQLQYMDFDLEKELLEHPLLLKTPIVRNGRKAAVGVNTDIWKQWLEENK